MYWTGVYRMLNAKDFSKEIGIGFGLEILFTWSLFFLEEIIKLSRQLIVKNHYSPQVHFNKLALS